MLEKIYHASAGTGKTEKIVNDFLKGVNKDNIKEKLKTTVFISFSNAAADELKQRLWKKLREKKENGEIFYNESDLLYMNVYTIHSFCLRVIKLLRHYLGLPVDIEFLTQTYKKETTLWSACVENYFLSHNLFTKYENYKEFFQLIDIKNFKNFIKRYGFLLFALNELGYEIKQYQGNLENQNINFEEFFKIKELLEEAEENNNISVFRRRENNEIVPKIPSFLNYLNTTGIEIINNLLKEIYADYNDRIYKEGILDYDAAIFLAAKLLKEVFKNERKEFFEALKNNGWEIKEIYLDEAQDNDILQNHLIIHFIREFGNNENKNSDNNENSDKNEDIKVTIVGDYKQSIYQWRDAYPEEFEKIIEECRQVKNRVETLKTSQRIVSKDTLNFINGFFNRVKECKNYWKYNEEDDKLEWSENNENKDSIIKAFFVREIENSSNNEQNCTEQQSHPLADILKLESGKIGILVRSRSQLRYIKDILENENVRYRIQEEQELSDLAKTEDNFFPELMLLNSLFILFDDENRFLFPFYLFFTLPGQKVLYKILENKKINLSGSESLEKLKNLFVELEKYAKDKNEEYRHRKITPAIYDVINELNLWEVMAHNNENIHNEIIRQINSFLGLIYQIEKTRKTLSVKESIKTYFFSPFLPVEWFELEDEQKDQNKKIIEVTTIHSAKGLTYDRAIVIANFNSDFWDDRPNYTLEKERYNYLFSVKFINILKENPKIEINYFPYLVLKKVLRLMINGNLTNYFPEFLTETFKEVNEKINNEKLNLLYVALTRTKKDLIFINTTPDICGPLELFGKREDVTIRKEEERDIAEFKYTNLSPQVLSLLEKETIKPIYVLSTARKENEKFFITEKTKQTINAWENYQHIAVGKLLHEILRNYVQTGKDIKTITDNLAKNNEIIKNILDNSENEIKLLENESGYSEFPFWVIIEEEKEKEKEKIISGIVDYFYEDNDKLKLYEYKTIFCDQNEDLDEKLEKIKTQYKGQIEIYKEALENLLNRECEAEIIFYKYIKKQ